MDAAACATCVPTTQALDAAKAGSVPSVPWELKDVRGPDGLPCAPAWQQAGQGQGKEQQSFPSQLQAGSASAAANGFASELYRMVQEPSKPDR